MTVLHYFSSHRNQNLSTNLLVNFCYLPFVVSFLLVPHAANDMG